MAGLGVAWLGKGAKHKRFSQFGSFGSEEIMRVSFELKGVMPLLMHSDDVEAADALDAWRKDPAHKNISRAGDDRSPAWTWQTYLYSDGTHITIPSQNLMVCLRYAGAQIVMKKQKTFKEASQSGLLIDSEFMEFRCNGEQIPIAAFDWLKAATEEPTDFSHEVAAAKKHGFRLFTKRAKVGQSKHIRVRPRFDSWTVTGSLEVYAPEITFSVLEQMFSIAGRGGLCDWRPNCRTPGPYGMYEAKLMKL